MIIWYDIENKFDVCTTGQLLSRFSTGLPIVRCDLVDERDFFKKSIVDIDEYSMLCFNKDIIYIKTRMSKNELVLLQKQCKQFCNGIRDLAKDNF